MSEWTEKDVKEISGWNEKAHPRGQPDNAGQFVKKDEKTASELKAELQREVEAKPLKVKNPTAKMTPAEKIASVHIDFSKDNILPELNEDTLKKIGTESKPVLLKSSSIKRNLQKHIDVSDETMENIITEALYKPIDVFPANAQKPHYFHLAAFVEVKEHNGLKIGLVLLDTDITKENIEIGHAYFVDSSGFEKAKNKAIKKD